MPPTGLAILLGAGPTTGAGIARILASPNHGNLAVALLSRSGSVPLANHIANTSDGGILRAFKTDTSEAQLQAAFAAIRAWNESGEIHDTPLPLMIAVWNIKHSHRTPFAEETAGVFGESVQVYVTGAMVFAQLVTKWMLEQSLPGERKGMQKRGTLIFTSTLGSLRTNAGYAAYGAGRAGVRMLAQSLAREYSSKGVHVVHAIANGGITDIVDGEDSGEHKEKVEKGEMIRAESVGRLYLQMMEQGCDLWCHEFDMRPAAEKF